MLECLILGDSIAVGTHWYYNREHKKARCHSEAKGGFNTWQWNKHFHSTPLDAKIVVISLGTNDNKFVHTEQELVSMRDRVHADRVYWIVPAIKPNIVEIVEKIARIRGDFLIPIKHLHSDRIHPSTEGYKEIVKSIH